MNHDTRYDVNPTLYSNVGKPAGESYQIITKQFLVNPGPGLDLPLGTWLLRGLGSSPGVRHGWWFPGTPGGTKSSKSWPWLWLERFESHGFWGFFWGAIYGSIRKYWLDCRWRNVEDWSKKQLWWNRGKCKSQFEVILWELYWLWRDCSRNFEGCNGVYRPVNGRWIAWLIENNLFYPPEDRDLTWFDSFHHEIDVFFPFSPGPISICIIEPWG